MLSRVRTILSSPVRLTYGETRYRIPRGRHVWEVDVFSGDNEGLTVAEIELSGEDESFERPAWVGPEVACSRKRTASAVDGLSGTGPGSEPGSGSDWAARTK